jgi:hypothetical protein
MSGAEETWRLRTLSVYPTPLMFTGTVVGRSQKKYGLSQRGASMIQ